MKRQFLSDFILNINNLLSKIVPDSFTIAIILTIIVFVGGLASETLYSHKPLFLSILHCISGWGDGFFTLLEFGMQMSLIILSGYIIASSTVVNRLLVAIIQFPKSDRSLATTIAALSMLLCYINWGFGLVAGALLVKTAYKIRKDINYVYLVSVAYLGLGTLWHGGLSASVPLLIATQNHFLSSKIGVVPVGETIFSSENLVLMTSIFVAFIVLVYLIYPSGRYEEVVVEFKDREESIQSNADKKITFAQRLEHFYLLNFVIFLFIMVYNAYDIYQGRFALTLNRVNIIFLGLGFLFHRSPYDFVRAAANGANLIIGVVIQFPLYAGIYGIIKGTSLLTVISNFFLTICSQKSLLFVIFLYSGILNYFVPSGGSKWVIEAPYIVDIADKLDVPIGKVAMFYAYGDMWTNLIQPFWAIPLLAAAGIEFKKILGYELIFAFLYGIIITVASFVF